MSSIHTPPSTPRPALTRSKTFGSPILSAPLPSPRPVSDYLTARPLSFRHELHKSPSPPANSHYLGGQTSAGAANYNLSASSTSFFNDSPSSSNIAESPCSPAESPFPVESPYEEAEIWMVNEKLCASPVVLHRISSSSRSTIPRPLSTASSNETPKQWSALHINRRSLPVPPRVPIGPVDRQHLPWEGLPSPPSSSTLPVPSPFSPRSNEFFNDPSLVIPHPFQSSHPVDLALPERPSRPNHATAAPDLPPTPHTAQPHHFDQRTPFTPSPAHYLPRISRVSTFASEMDVDREDGAAEAVSLSNRRGREIFDLGEGSSRGIQRGRRPSSVITKQRSASYTSSVPVPNPLPGASYINADLNIFSPTRPSASNAPLQALFTPNRSIPPMTLPPSSAFRNYLRPSHPPPRPPPTSFPSYLSTSDSTTPASTTRYPASTPYHPPQSRPNASTRPRPASLPNVQALYSIRNRLSLLEDELDREIKRIEAEEEKVLEEEERKKAEWSRIDAEWAGMRITWGPREERQSVAYGRAEKRGSWLSRKFSSRKERR